MPNTLALRWQITRPNGNPPDLFQLADYCLNKLSSDEAQHVRAWAEYSKIVRAKLTAIRDDLLEDFEGDNHRGQIETVLIPNVFALTNLDSVLDAYKNQKPLGYTQEIIEWLLAEEPSLREYYYNKFINKPNIVVSIKSKRSSRKIQAFGAIAAAIGFVMILQFPQQPSFEYQPWPFVDTKSGRFPAAVDDESLKKGAFQYGIRQAILESIENISDKPKWSNLIAKLPTSMPDCDSETPMLCDSLPKYAEQGKGVVMKEFQCQRDYPDKVGIYDDRECQVNYKNLLELFSES